MGSEYSLVITWQPDSLLSNRCLSWEWECVLDTEAIWPLLASAIEGLPLNSRIQSLFQHLWKKTFVLDWPLFETHHLNCIWLFSGSDLLFPSVYTCSEWLILSVCRKYNGEYINSRLNEFSKSVLNIILVISNLQLIHDMSTEYKMMIHRWIYWALLPAYSGAC